MKSLIAISLLSLPVHADVTELSRHTGIGWTVICYSNNDQPEGIYFEKYNRTEPQVATIRNQKVWFSLCWEPRYQAGPCKGCHE